MIVIAGEDITIFYIIKIFGIDMKNIIEKLFIGPKYPGFVREDGSYVNARDFLEKCKWDNEHMAFFPRIYFITKTFISNRIDNIQCFS